MMKIVDKLLCFYYIFIALPVTFVLLLIQCAVLFIPLKDEDFCVNYENIKAAYKDALDELL